MVGETSVAGELGPLGQGGLFAGRYLVQRLLGQGDRKWTYLAEDQKVGDRLVALSLIKPEAAAIDPEGTRREANRLSRVGSYSHIVTFHEYDSHDGTEYLVFEYVSGGRLSDLIEHAAATGEKVPADVIVRYGRELAGALEQVHTAGMIHRDVAPENIWLDYRNKVKLGDFDSAILLADLDEPRPSTTDRYRSPEDRDGGPLDARTDLYSLGAVLASLALGQLDFEVGAPNTSRRPDLPEAFHDLVAALLAPRREDRPSSAGEVRRRLKEIEALPELGRPFDDDADFPAPDSAELRSRSTPGRYEVGERIAGRFEVLDLLDEGGFATVFRVRDEVEGEERALKLFKSAAGYEAVRREIAALRRVRHPKVVEVFWADKTEAGEWYLVEEYVEGESLHHYVVGPAHLRDREAIDVALDVLEAVCAIHPDAAQIEALKEKEKLDGGLSKSEFAKLHELQTKGLVHRDIKPKNIILTRTGAKLLDFNIASRVGETVRTTSGTPAYQAPDASFTRWDTSTDLFAVGVVLYQLLCDGEHPYPGAQPMVDEPVTDPRRFRPDLPDALAEFLVRACASEQRQRFTSAAAMREELRRIRLAL